MVIRRKKSEEKEKTVNYFRCDDCFEKIPESEAEITKDGIFCEKCYDEYLRVQMQPIIAKKS